MTAEQQIEEILWEAHAYGLRSEVMNEARAQLQSNPKLDKVVVYEKAFTKLTIDIK
jgi:hypothetical protein